MNPLASSLRARAFAVAGALSLAAGLVACDAGDGPASKSAPAVGASQGESIDAAPSERPRLRDLSPEEVAQLPDATVVGAVFGADLDHRALVWQRGRREVLARTTDGGATWTYTGEPGTYAELAAVGGASNSFWVSVTSGNGVRRTESLVDGRGQLVAVAAPEGMAPVAPDEVLALHLPRPNQERQVAVAPDGTSHYWPGDPFLEEERTGDVGGWTSAVRLPAGRIFQQVAGKQADFSGFCCAPRPVIRWSDDGGASWTTRALDDLGADPDAIFPFSTVIPSLDPATVAVHESTEGGTLTGRPVLATQRFAADSPAADRFAAQFGSSRVNVAWSVVLPDGALLVWVDAQGSAGAAGPWLSDGDDWGAMAPAADFAPPSGVEVVGLELADARLVDGQGRVVAVSTSGSMLVIEGDGATWTTVDPSR